MKRFGWLAVVSGLCLWILLGAGVAHAITYQFLGQLFPSGPPGSLIVEFMTSTFVDGTTVLNPLTLTVAPTGLSTTGRLVGGLGAPGFQPTFTYFGVGGSGMTAHIDLPFGNPANQFPTSAGTFALSGSAVTGSTGLIALLNTLVISDVPTAVPEPSSLALVGSGLAGLLGYAWRRRHRAAHPAHG